MKKLSEDKSTRESWMRMDGIIIAREENGTEYKITKVQPFEILVIPKYDHSERIQPPLCKSPWYTWEIS